jgi:hypothetical protein
MVGSILQEQLIANPRTSAHAQRSKCGALSFKASAKIDFRSGRCSVYTPLREKCMTRREGEAPAEPINSMGAKRIFHGSAGPRPPHEPSGRCISGHQLCASTTRMLFVVRSLEGFPDAFRSKRVPGMVFSPENLARLEVLECGALRRFDVPVQIKQWRGAPHSKDLRCGVSILSPRLLKEGDTNLPRKDLAPHHARQLKGNL